MNQAQQTNTEVAEEIFKQLQASKVNGFPLFAYTGLKPQIFSATELYLKAPRNPNKVSNILVSYQYGSDTYTVVINGTERLEDIYADGLADLIVRKMGVN
jgi:hypothetical protein